MGNMWCLSKRLLEETYYRIWVWARKFGAKSKIVETHSRLGAVSKPG